MNVKEEFIKWFLSNKGDKYQSVSENVIKNDIGTSIELLGRDIFEVTQENFREVSNYIEENLYKKNTPFDDFSSITNHRPRAILGKKNYLRFLEEKFLSKKAGLPYSEAEKKKLEEYYDSLQNKFSFKHWLILGSALLRDLEIDTSKCRAAITREKEAMLLLGMKPIFSYREVEGKSIWGFILSQNFIDNNKVDFSLFDVFNFAEGNQKKHLLARFHISSAEKFEDDFSNEFYNSVKINYESIQDSNLTSWNQEASTTNNALKHVLVNDENIENWFKDIKHIELGRKKLFKLSMGTFLKTKKYRDKKVLKDILYQSIGVMHEQTGMGQAETFKNKADIGDYIYVTYGKDKLDGLYRIVSDYEEIDDHIKQAIGEDGYLYRILEKLKSPLINHTRDLKRDTRAWMPSGNTTFYEITDLEEANTVLFKPYYDVEFKSEKTIKTGGMNTIKAKFPLNQILYGPPGTGKTYKTKSLAVQIVNPDFSANGSNEFERRESIVLEYDRLFENEQIVFTTFHQSFGYEDFVEGIKPSTTEDKKVIYDVAPGVFKKLCEKAKNNWLEFKKGNRNRLSFDKAFAKLKEEWEENENISFPLKTQGKEYKIIGFTESSIQFEKASGGTGHTLSIATLRDAYYDRKEIRSTGVGIYYPGILNKLYSYDSNGSEALMPESSEPTLKNYVLVIDEINRGNVSGIFGELITLLESDKRMGRSEEISVELPYSKEQFTVPPNVYLIGTMNTADRSVEALDTALRRRFAFEEIIPKPELLKNITFEGFNLQEILTTINERIEALVDRDHTIGHSYFIKIEPGETEELQQAFENKVIPLLQEYFYNDYEKIALVLGKGFVEKKDVKVKFAKFADIEDPDLESTYSLKPIEDIEEALLNLLNRSEED